MATQVRRPQNRLAKAVCVDEPIVPLLVGTHLDATVKKLVDAAPSRGISRPPVVPDDTRDKCIRLDASVFEVPSVQQPVAQGKDLPNIALNVRVVLRMSYDKPTCDTI